MSKTSEHPEVVVLKSSSSAMRHCHGLTNEFHNFFFHLQLHTTNDERDFNVEEVENHKTLDSLENIEAAAKHSSMCLMSGKSRFYFRFRIIELPT